MVESFDHLFCVPSMALVLLVKVQPQVFTAKCSEIVEPYTRLVRTVQWEGRENIVLPLPYWHIKKQCRFIR